MRPVIGAVISAALFWEELVPLPPEVPLPAVLRELVSQVSFPLIAWPFFASWKSVQIVALLLEV